MRDTTLPAARFAEGPHRPGRPPGLRAALGRRPRSARLSHGRRRGPGRRVHHRRRPHEVRADDAGGRQGRAEAGLRRGDDDAAEPARRGRPARPGLGHRFALRRVVRALLLDALLRPYRLYRHGDLDRSRDENLPDRAHQPAASRRQGQHPADAAAHRRGRGRRVARPAGARAVGHRRARSLWLSRAGGTPGRAHNQPLGARFGGTADRRCAAPGARSASLWRCSAPSTVSTHRPRARSPPAAIPRPACRSTVSTAARCGRRPAMLAGLDALVVRHAGRRHALLHLSHDHGLRDGGRGAEPARFLRARPARPDHRRPRCRGRCSMPTSPRSSPICPCRCATA